MKALMFTMKAFMLALALLVSLSPAAFARCNAYDEVYLFEQPRCLPCMAAKRLLAEHGIRYESRDARSSAECLVYADLCRDVGNAGDHDREPPGRVSACGRIQCAVAESVPLPAVRTAYGRVVGPD